MYAFVAAPASLPDVAGIDGAPLRAEHVGGLDVVVSDHEQAVEQSEAAVLGHAAVVDALAAAHDAVVPARFGGAYASGTALRAAVANRPELLDALARVRGCVEFGLRVLAGPSDPVAAGSGAGYMRARLEQQRRSEHLAETIHGPLVRHAREATSTVGATPRLLLSAAYLVDRAAADAFRAEVAGLQQRHPSLTLVCTGPWPPYSFVLADGGSA